jgi:hypothetical protein
MKKITKPNDPKSLYKSNKNTRRKEIKNNRIVYKLTIIPVHPLKSITEG